MAWTTPRTAVVGSIVEASFWNVSIRDNFLALQIDQIQADQILVGVSPRVIRRADAAAQAFRPGTTRRFPDTGTIPDGYLECDGSLASKTTYAALFAVVGTLFGAGDATRFELPSLTAGSGLVWIIKT